LPFIKLIGCSVQEPRALDSVERLKRKFEAVQDRKSVELIKLICHEEIQHVKIGVHWFTHLCSKYGKSPIPTFHQLALQYTGVIPPPFNAIDRKLAGMSEDWYIPISAQKKVVEKI